MDDRPQQKLVAEWADPYDFDRRRQWILLGLLLALTAIAYGPLLSAQFLWRDDRIITANEAIGSWRAVGHTWLHPRSVPVYRPVADTLLCLEHNLWGNWNPTGYHIVSLGLHLLATMLLWLVLRRLHVPAPLLGAGLFALHPVAAHTVTWAAQQPVLLASVFALLSLLAWLRWSDPPSAAIDDGNAPHRPWVPAFATFAFFVASLLSDAGIAFALPAAMPLIAGWNVRATIDPTAKRRLIAMQVIAVLLTLLIVWSRSAPLASPISAGYAAWSHLLKLIVPYPLLLAYSPGARPAELALSLVLFAAIIAAIALRHRLPRALLAAAGVYLCMLLPPIVLSDGIFDAQQYLARASLLALAAAGVSKLIPETSDDDDEVRHRALRPVLAIVLFVLLGAGAWWQASLCRTNRAAWEHVLAHDPGSRRARLELGNEALARNEFAGAIEQFAAALARDPNDAEAHMTLGTVLLNRGDIDEAAAHFEKSIALRPRDPAGWRHLATVAARKDDLPAAVAHYEKALSLNPRDAMARNNLATVYVRQGKLPEAIAAYEQSLKDNPTNAPAHVNLARILFDTGKLQQSADHLQQAVAIDPNNFDAYMTAGSVLLKLNDIHKASRMFQMAVKLRRDNPEALNLLGVSLAAQGQYGEAVFQFGRALDVNPNYAPAKQNLESARRDQERAATQPTR